MYTEGDTLQFLTPPPTPFRDIRHFIKKFDIRHLLIIQPSVIKSVHKPATIATKLNYTVKIVGLCSLKSPVFPQISQHQIQALQSISS